MSDWIACAERMPAWEYDVLWYDISGFICLGSQPPMNATHWCELPPPPQGAQTK